MLTKKEHEVFECIRSGILDIRDISQQLGMTVPAIKNHIYRMKQKGVLILKKSRRTTRANYKPIKNKQNPPLCKYLYKLAMVMTYAVEEADKLGISRSNIDIAKLLEVVREEDMHHGNNIQFEY